MEKQFTPYALFVFINNLANKDLEIKARKSHPPSASYRERRCDMIYRKPLLGQDVFIGKYSKEKFKKQ